MKIRAYTLDRSKLLKRGAPEYDPHQEQAKTDVTLNGHVGQECYVEIMDEELRKELFSMCNIANADWTKPICVSLHIFEEDKAFLTMYYLGIFGNPVHRNIGCYVEKDSDYGLCQKVIDKLVQAEKER